MAEMSFDSILLPGTRVEVRNHYTRTWARGFAVVAVDADGYRLQRLSDGARLPVAFGTDEVRPAVPSSPIPSLGTVV